MGQLRKNLHRFVANSLIEVGREHRLLALLRERENKRLKDRLGNEVLYGPLKGFKLQEAAQWGAADHPLKVLGLYEQPVQAILSDLAPLNRIYCLGAADGFFGVGTVATGLAKRSLNWEMVAESQRIMNEAAEANGVADRIRSFGIAESDFVAQSGEDAPGTDDLVLIDVEGAEYDILSETTLKALSATNVIIELHPFLVSDGEAREQTLLDDAAAVFDVEMIDDAVRDLSGISEMREMSDDARWLACSEARERQMRWAFFRTRKV